MRVTVLMENATPNDRLCAKHGLSLFLEANGEGILFDMGPDAAFLDNAKVLGIDVASADVAILSHGHFDHAGGLEAFLAANDHAPVFASELAFKSHAVNTPVGYKDIGANPRLQKNPRVTLAGEKREIGQNLTLFSRVEPKRLFSKSNAVLLEESGGGYVPDRFAHEQSLIVREGEKFFLVSGCSHAGVVNIIERAEEIAGAPMDAVIAGFHLMDPGSGKVEDPALTRAVAEFLASRPSRYFTFHCTGLSAYGVLRDVLGQRVEYLFAGSVVEL